MLKRMLSRVHSKDPVEPTAVDEAVLPTAAAPAAATPVRKTKSMRDSDIKDEHGRSAEEIAAEAAREFDIDAVVRKAALPDTAPKAAVAPVIETPTMEAPVAPPKAQPAVAASTPKPAAPTKPVVSTGVQLEAGHIFLPGATPAEIKQTRTARGVYWDAIGTSDPDLLGYPVSPQVLSQPAWPTQHQNFRIVRTAGSLIVASEGLSDPFGPFDGRSGANGFGLEVFVELVGWQEKSAADIRKSWAFKAVEYVARVAAHAQTLNQVVSGHEVLSIDLPIHCVPNGWVEPGIADPAGALLNVAQPPGRSSIANMPFSPVSVVPVTPIYPEELESCVVEGPSERRALANDLLTSGAGHRMHTARTSLR